MSNKEQIARAMSASNTGLRFEEIRKLGIANEAIVRHEIKEMESHGYVKRTGSAATTRYELTMSGRMMFIIGNDEITLTKSEKAHVETVEAAPIVEESVLEQIENEVVTEEITATEIPINKMELETFDVFQLTDNLASSFIKLIQSKQAKSIENIDYKIATLESLADIYNPKISATLREIAIDLRG